MNKINQKVVPRKATIHRGNYPRQSKECQKLIKGNGLKWLR